jgi:alcohol dehydrogenase class IV
MRRFVFQAQPSRVIFGAGALADLAREADLLDLKRVLVLSTPGQVNLAALAAQRLGSRVVGVFSKAVMHVPRGTVQQACGVARQLGADCTLAIGGGSTTGLAKAIALEANLPIIAVPTTYAGSEMTPVYGITEAGIKRTGQSDRVLPKCVIYDPELTLGLPLSVSLTSGMNAIAHAAEGLYSKDANPVTDLMAQEGIRALAQALPALKHDAGDLAARSEALYGAWLCGIVMGSVGMALHHKLCHTLGGTFNLPHAECHAVVLPFAMAFNASHAPEAMVRIQQALRTGQSAAAGLYDLSKKNGLALSLRELGMREEDLDRAAQLAVLNPYWNPRPIGPHQLSCVRELLQSAFEGARPVV